MSHFINCRSYMEGETNLLTNRMGNNGVCQLPPFRKFKSY